MSPKIFFTLFAALFLAVHIGVKQATQPVFDGTRPKPGQTAQPFTAKTFTGETIELTSYAKAHKLTILNFWETWCGPCKMEMPDLQRMHEQYGNQGLGILGVYGNSSEEAVKQLLSDKGLTFAMLRDEKGAISGSYAVRAVPTTLVLDSDLKVLRQVEGVDFGLSSFVKNEFSRMEKKKS